MMLMIIVDVGDVVGNLFGDVVVVVVIDIVIVDIVIYLLYSLLICSDIYC